MFEEEEKQKQVQRLKGELIDAVRNAVFNSPEVEAAKYIKSRKSGYYLVLGLDLHGLVCEVLNSQYFIESKAKQNIRVEEDNKYKEVFNEVSMAVTDAVIWSEKVRTVVSEIKELELVDEFKDSKMGLYIPIKGQENTQKQLPLARIRWQIPNNGLKNTQKQLSSVSSYFMNQIDGKVPSKNEEKYLEYVADNFNQDDWIRKARIRLEP